MRTRMSVLALGLITTIAMGAGPVTAAEITILANQGAVSGVRDLASGFEQKTGTKVNVVFAQGAEMAAMIDGDKPADLISQFLEQFEDLVKRGKVVPGSFVEYAKVGNGVAVKAGAPKPDISTPAAFKQAMLDAKSIGHSSNGTGTYNTRLFQKLGIYEQIKHKIKISNGGPIAGEVAKGTFEIGLQQTNVIQPFPGTDYIGPLPRELMEYGHIGVGLLTVSKQPDLARDFIKFMTSAEAGPLLRKSTMESP